MIRSWTRQRLQPPQRALGGMDHSYTWLLSGGRLVLVQALDTLLAPAAGLGFRQRREPLRLDRLVAELAGSVGTAVHTFERCGEAIDAARESLPLPRDGFQILALSGMRPCWLFGRWSGPHHSDLLDRSGPFALEALSNFGLAVLRHSCCLREGGRAEPRGQRPGRPSL